MVARETTTRQRPGKTELVRRNTLSTSSTNDRAFGSAETGGRLRVCADSNDEARRGGAFLCAPRGRRLAGVDPASVVRGDCGQSRARISGSLAETRSGGLSRDCGTGRRRAVWKAPLLGRSAAAQFFFCAPEHFGRIDVLPPGVPDIDSQGVPFLGHQPNTVRQRAIITFEDAPQ